MDKPALSSHVLTSAATWRDHWRLGRLYRYPRCCIARWVIGWALNEGAQGAKRGANCDGWDRCYVRCGVFHRG